MNRKALQRRMQPLEGLLDKVVKICCEKSAHPQAVRQMGDHAVRQCGLFTFGQIVEKIIDRCRIRRTK